jgi:hypothetical protein
MPFEPSQGRDVKRRMTAGLALEMLARHIDLRVVYDVVVVSAVLLIGALLWLVLAQPLPARLNRAFDPTSCSLMEREGKALRAHAPGGVSDAIVRMFRAERSCPPQVDATLSAFHAAEFRMEGLSDGGPQQRGD